MRTSIKTIFAVALLAAIMAVFSGCADESYHPEESEPLVESPAIGKDGLLRVGVDTSKAPLAGVMDATKAVVGIDVDTAAAIADILGLKVEIIDVGSDVESALNEGKVDIVMGINNADPGSGYWISNAYLPTGIAAFSTEQDAGIPSVDAGSTFAAQISSTSAWAVDNEFGSDVLTSVTTLPEAFEKLTDGDVDYVAADAIVGYYAARNLADEVFIDALLIKPSGYCIAVASENTELQEVVNAAVSEITGNGVLSVIEKKWLGSVLSLTDVPLTAGASVTTLASDDVTGEDGETQPTEGQAAPDGDEPAEGAGADDADEGADAAAA